MKTRCVVLITAMDQPLGRAIGNAIEVQECIDLLNGNGPADLELLTLALSAHMIRLGGRARTIAQATDMARHAISSGAAAQRFREIIRAQGGDPRVIDDPDIVVKASHGHAFKAPATGYVSRCEAKLLGLASNALGAGRAAVTDVIDPAAGIYLEKKTGDRVKKGETLCTLHYNDEEKLRRALPLVRKAYEIKSRAAKPQPLIRAILS